MLFFLALVVAINAANAQLCNFRRFPSKGCSAGSICNQYSGMCSVSPPSPASTATTYSVPSSYATYTATAINHRNYTHETTNERNASRSGSNSLTIALDSTAEPVTALKALPTYAEEAVTSLPEKATSLSGMTITVICLAAVITLLLFFLLLYVVARVLRQPVDLFSTSADVFEMTFISNS